jgi:hypothetical protein
LCIFNTPFLVGEAEEHRLGWLTSGERYLISVAPIGAPIQKRRLDKCKQTTDDR